MLCRPGLKKACNFPHNSRLKFQVQGNRKCSTLFHVVSRHSLSWRPFCPCVWIGRVILSVHLELPNLPRALDLPCFNISIVQHGEKQEMGSTELVKFLLWDPQINREGSRNNYVGCWCVWPTHTDMCVWHTHTYTHVCVYVRSIEFNSCGTLSATIHLI